MNKWAMALIPVLHSWEYVYINYRRNRACSVCGKEQTECSVAAPCFDWTGEDLYWETVKIGNKEKHFRTPTKKEE